MVINLIILDSKTKLKKAEQCKDAFEKNPK